MRRVGGWELLEELGRGGLGQVWRARDPRSGEEVALKLLHREAWQLAPEERERFAREGAALARVHDPGVAGFRALELDENPPHLVMELVPGETLEARLAREGPLPPAEAAGIGRELARTLGRLHAVGVVHRDLKPANVVLRPDGRPVLLDLGLALLLERAGHLTRTGEVLGTPAWMAPEQVMGQPGSVGPAADVYALGALLFALVCGRPPFVGETVALLGETLGRPAPAPSSLRRGLQVGWDDLLARCLAKEPGARPSPGQVEQALLALCLAPARSPRRAALGLAAAGTALVAGLVGGSLALRGAGAAGAAPVGRAARAEAELLVVRGEARADAGDVEAGLADLERALRLDPGLPLAWVARASVRRHQGDRVGALADCERALQLDPTCTRAWLGRGYLRCELGDRAGGKADFERALELDPRSSRAHLNLGTLREEVGDLAGARALYERALELDPRCALAWLDRGHLYLEAGELALALADFERVIELEPRNPEGYVNRGVARLCGGDDVGATADYERAVELDPRCASALLNRASMREKAGDLRGPWWTASATWSWRRRRPRRPSSGPGWRSSGPGCRGRDRSP